MEQCEVQIKGQPCGNPQVVDIRRVNGELIFICLSCHERMLEED